MDMSNDKVFAALKQANLRPTRQRVALGGLLFDGKDRHVTAEQLHQEALGLGIGVSLATVYNTLHQFIHAGLLKQVVVELGQYYFDTNVGPHHHFYHVDSRKLEDIHDSEIEISNLPALPAGMCVSYVDVIIRVQDQDK